MTIMNYLQEAQKFEIQLFKKAKDIKTLRKNHVPYTGSPHKHPLDEERVILIMDPYGGQRTYYEFKAEDIAYVEELPNMVTAEGKSIAMTRIWVKKKCIGIQCIPFIVDEIE